MRVCIKNPAPDNEHGAMWGDYYFGWALQQALSEQGLEVTQQLWPNWYQDPDTADVVIVLRGKRRYQPMTPQPAILWVISHPATLSLEELNDYAVACVASRRHAEMIQDATKAHVRILEQCTDTARFYPADSKQPAEREGVLMVANSRGLLRPILDWALQAGTPPKIIGRGWSEAGVGGLVVQEHIDNAELAGLYRRTKICLNDHWNDMRYFGIVNNRILDCLACGVPIITDDFPEVRAIVGNAAIGVSNAREYKNALSELEQRYPEYTENAARRWQTLEHAYSFNARAEVLADLIHKVVAGRLSQASCGQSEAPEPKNQDSEKASLQILGALIQQARQEQNGQTLQLLLFAPTTPIAAACLGYPDVSPQSAGVGSGPWEIELDANLASLQHVQYHVIFVEQSDNLARLPESQWFRFVAALADRLQLGGYIAFAEAKPRWQAIISWIDLTKCQLTSSVTFYQRSQPKPVESVFLAKEAKLKQRLVDKDQQIRDLKAQLRDWRRYGALRQVQVLSHWLLRKALNCFNASSRK